MRDTGHPSSWPFADPPNVAVFTSKSIIEGRDWVHYVSHDEEDGAWQFHPYGGFATVAESAIVGLGTMLEIDPSLAALAELPLGWYAWRDVRDGEWQVTRREAP